MQAREDQPSRNRISFTAGSIAFKGARRSAATGPARFTHLYAGDERRKDACLMMRARMLGEAGRNMGMSGPFQVRLLREPDLRPVRSRVRSGRRTSRWGGRAGKKDEDHPHG